MTVKIRFKFFVFMTALLVLGGCQTSMFGSKQAEQEAADYEPHEADTNADGEVSPLEAHLMARKLVNPKGDSSRYTYQADKPHEDFHHRLQVLSGDNPGEFKSAHAISAEDSGIDSAAPPKPGIKPELPGASPRISPMPLSDETDVPLEMSDITINPAPIPPRKPQDHSEVAVQQTQEAPQAPRPKPTFAGGGAAVTGLRLGEHPGKTRLVLDLSASSGYSVNIDNAAHVLRIELPQAGWDMANEKTFSNHALFKSYSVHSMASGGTVLNIDLKQDSKVLTSVALPPNESAGFRIYFDVGPA